jgi:undecaprenyl pyrophosphate synthase
VTSEQTHSEAQYYVIVAGHGSRAASGLARRRYTQAGPADETLRRDLSWQADSAIVEWEYGDLDAELVKISYQEAENLTQAFRARLERAT